jgi:hypothetical protein
MFFSGPRHFLGVKLPPPNLQPEFATQARTFIDGVADRTVGGSRSDTG